VNSDKPKDEYLIPFKLTWSDSPLQVKSISYPPSEELKVGTDTLSVFTGAINVETEFKAPPEAAAGTMIVTGTLRYQACNDQMCFRPASIGLRLPVVIE
jgi:thiol:disulfide interchange protein DsbD